MVNMMVVLVLGVVLWTEAMRGKGKKKRRVMNSMTTYDDDQSRHSDPYIDVENF
jgi:hypothetical protein